MKLAKNLERLGTESAFKILAEAKKLELEGKKIIHLSIALIDFKYNWKNAIIFFSENKKYDKKF